MLTGDRRWLSARRGGMTVLGKVTVPKPINLPSQRLENHGLDPNVEIVPKGTLNWGTRSSSSAQNAWASPAQSPPKYGGTESPNHLNGRPSSGGGGSRPSTAGSDRSHEPVPNVWGTSSRPSSASGLSTSTQTSVAAARPRSAEPRPASSHLSRFAEPISENSITWGASGTMEKLGVSSSKCKDFSLSSGDFPTLGSEKIAESLMQQDHSSQGRPVSASGRVATPKQGSEASPSEDGYLNASKESGAVNTLNNDNILEVDAGNPPGMENWQRETKPYPDQSMPPQQFGPWHGAPHNPPNGVWYRGPFGGPPYGPPGPPGSYPQDPFAYYHPRLPGHPIANLQPGLRPGSAPRGYFPEKGESHRPHMPDSYIQPVMPYGPGPYPVQIQYDGYYGPPQVGSCISSDRRPPAMGMGAPCVYNRYPMQNVHPEPGNFHGSSGYAPPNTRSKEQEGSGQPYSSRQGPYKVLLKHQDGWDENDCKDQREHTLSTPYHERDNLPGAHTMLIGEGADRNHGEQMNHSKVSSAAVSSQYADSRESHPSLPVGSNLLEKTSNVNRVGDHLMRKTETASVPVEDPQHMAAKRNPSLIEKIESLNQKARMSDGRYEERLKSLRALSTKADDTPTEAGNDVDYSNKAATSRLVSTPTIEMHPTGDRRPDLLTITGADVSRPIHEPQASAVQRINSSSGKELIHRNTPKRPHGAQSRTEDRGKGGSNPTKDEEWRKKPFGADPAEVPSKKDETCDDKMLDHHAALRESEKPILNQGKAGGDLSAFVPSDHQRAKMREIVAERAKQLQKEEEERTREQKARALAKLEELNRRTSAEISAEKVDHALPQTGLPQNKGGDFQYTTDQARVTDTSNEIVCSASGWDYGTITPGWDYEVTPSGWECDEVTPSGWECDTVATETNYDTHGHEGSTHLPENVQLEAPIRAQQIPVVKSSLCLPLPPEVEAGKVASPKTSQAHDSTVMKQKHIGFKKKQNTNRNPSDKPISTGDSDGHRSHANLVGDISSLSGKLNPQGNANAADDSLLKHKKKNNRGKNKQKSDEVSTTHSPKVIPLDGNSLKPSADLNKPKTTVSVFEVGSVQVPFSVEIAETLDSVVLSTDQGQSISSEEVHAMVNNQLKPHPPRRMPRNTQGRRTIEKVHGSESVVWAPVGTVKKTDDSEEATLNSSEVHTSSVTNHGAQSNHKSRRAEMERYVPKPVAKEAKEHSVQGSMEQQPQSSSINQAATIGSSGRADSISLNKEFIGPDGLSSGKGGLPVSKVGESKHNKHAKTHGLWRPRASGEIPSVQPCLDESCHSSGSSTTVLKSFEQHQTQKADIYLPKEQAKCFDNSNDSSNPVLNEPVTDPGVKDHGATNRGKRQPFKGHKTVGNIRSTPDHDSRGRDTFEVGSQSSLELNKLDGGTVGEKHAGDMNKQSHWQPKSRVQGLHNHHESIRGSGGERVPKRVDTAPPKAHPTPSGNFISRVDQDYSQPQVQPHREISNEKKTSVAEAENLNHQETKLERKDVDSRKQVSRFADQYPANQAKLRDPHESVNNQRQGHQSRYGRALEVQDSNKQQLHPSSSRQRHASHYEYQRARSNANEPNESFDEGPRATGSRYRERGQSHARRGGSNSYARKE